MHIVQPTQGDSLSSGADGARRARQRCAHWTRLALCDTLDPGWLARQVWDVVMLVCILYIAIAIPFEVRPSPQPCMRCG